VLGNVEAISREKLSKFARYSKIENGKFYKDILIEEDKVHRVLSDAVNKRQRLLLGIRDNKNSMKTGLDEMRKSQGEIRCCSEDTKPFWEVGRIS